MALSDHILWYIDANTMAGVLHERLLAALVLSEGLWCGLVFTVPAAGPPTVAFWERIDDLERGGFAPITAQRARATCDALPRFLERLEQAEGADSGG